MRQFEETELTKIIKLALTVAGGTIDPALTIKEQSEMLKLLKKIETDKLDASFVSREL